MTYDDAFDGEAYDSRVAHDIRGWDIYHLSDLVGSGTPAWEPAVLPSLSPADYNATMRVHTIQTLVIRDYSMATGRQHQPIPSVWVFDFGQNMAGIATLRVHNCAAGTIVRLSFGEMTWGGNHTLHNQSLPGMARMFANYTCAGGSAMEEYQT